MCWDERSLRVSSCESKHGTYCASFVCRIRVHVVLHAVLWGFYVCIGGDVQVNPRVLICWAIQKDPDFVFHSGTGGVDGAPSAGNRRRSEGNCELSILSVWRRAFSCAFLPHGRPCLICPLLQILLQYFAADFPLDSQLFSYSISDLKVGTFDKEKIITLSPTASLYEFLSTMITTGLGGLPVVDEEGTLVDIFSRYPLPCSSSQ